MRDASKSSLYRNEVTEAAVACIRQTLARLRRARIHADRAGIRTSRRARARASADAPVGSRHRLASRRYRRPSCAGFARPTASPACATTSRACRAICTTRIAKGACAATRVPSSPRAAARSAARRATARSGSAHLRARRRPGRVQAPGRDGSRRSSGERPGIAAGAGRSGRLSDVAADPLRRGRAGRLSCISRSTTAPWARRSARRCAGRTPMRARGRRASSRSWAARISGPTGSIST